MEREGQFLQRWREEREMYDAWGSFVIAKIIEVLSSSEKVSNVAHFLKIPATHRVKDEASLLAKAFHRSKSYKDPYHEIEDKVGGRIVVLFAEDIRFIENMIVSCSNWNAALARDFE